MTISSTTVKNSYSGDGSTTTFNYTFKIFADSDLQVIIRSSTATETVKTITTHYTVTGAGNANGGTVVFTAGNIPASGETVVLRRAVPQTQAIDYIANDPFPAESHEEGLDRATMTTQQIQEELDRSIKLSRTNTMTSTEFSVGASDRANKILAFDGNGEISVTQELGTFVGNWSASTDYNARDIVKDTSTNNIFICNTSHTSSGSQPLTTNTDSAKWDLLVDAASATTSATNAAASATAAASSATSAASSATTATTKASEASTSASNASTSASTASTQATNASTSATSAASSATTATTKASEASTSASNASTSETNAATSATNAGTSETNAASSATSAASSATTATTKASEAASSATSAASSASTATTKASEAATSATNAATSFDNFDDVYLGAKSSDPTQDNDGDALATGMLYTNTVAGTLKYYSGSAWVAVTSGGISDVVQDTSPQLGGNLDVNGNDIVSTSNADIDIIPNGTGKTNFGGTNGIVLPSGTTAQRVNTTGVLRFNSTTGLAEYFDGSSFRPIDSPPVLTSVSPALIDSNSGSTTNVVLTGSNFGSGASVVFIPNSGSNVSPNSTTVDSATQITVAVTDSNFVNANEPYDVKVTATSGLTATLADAINVDTTVAWQTAAGSLGSVSDSATGTHFTVSATDADSDTITYSVQSGSLPGGLSLNSSTGAISGDPTDVSSSTTSNFTLRAGTTDANADRAFSITITPTILAEYLIVAGGGGGSDEFAGGGAGGYRTNRGGTKIQLASGTTYTATVGSGGAGSGEGQDGGDSSLSGSGLTTITSTGGGGGTRSAGNSGGSGAGGSAEAPPSNAAGAGNTPSTSPSQGNPGGPGAATGGGARGGGAGGGAGGTGGSGSPSNAGNGGSGSSNDITGSSVTYAGGGAGAGDAPSNNSRGSPGSGGGGGSSGINGTDGLGGGGAAFGRPTGTGGAGGDGVVILRLPTANYTGTTTGSPTVTTSGSDTIIKFTSTGTYTA